MGLVTVGIPRPLGDVVAASLLECMSLALPATDTESFSRAAIEPAFEFAADKDAVVLGPGVGRAPETADLVLALVERCSAPMLIDADGLNNLSAKPEVLQEATAQAVVTPHPGEMARLAGLATQDVQRDRESVAAAFAAKHGCVVVLKGHRTVVAGADGRMHVNPTGNSGMATGGTGDVLSGLIGGLLAQGMPPYDAALVGVYLHGLAGDIAAEAMTERGMIAGDVVQALGRAWRQLERGDAS